MNFRSSLSPRLEAIALAVLAGIGVVTTVSGLALTTLVSPAATLSWLDCSDGANGSVVACHGGWAFRPPWL